MFRNAKVGDRVWDFIEQRGTIIRIHDKSDFLDLSIFFRH